MKKEVRTVSLTTFMQSLYLTVTYSLSNDLLSYASSCAFGFLFSLIPTVMMVLVVLMQIFHASPDILFSFLEKYDFFTEFFSTESMRESILQLRGFGLFEIVIAIAIIMMARRFFSSVNKGLNNIFKTVLPPKPFSRQLLIFAGEAVIIIIISMIVATIGLLRAVLRAPYFEPFLAQFSDLILVLTQQLTATIPNVLVFLVVLLCYRQWSRTKPSMVLCSLAAAACAFLFWAFTRLTSIFINVNNFNIVYGVLSNAIVLLLEVHVFFMLFLFFGQYIFVIQFFDTLLLSELYVLPQHDDTRLSASLKRMLFIRPDYLLQNEHNGRRVAKDGIVFSPGDTDRNTYYIVRGTVQVRGTTSFGYHEAGSFFGEEGCILNEPRKNYAIATTDVQLVCIDEDTFLSLLEKNTAASRKALSQISSYFARVYGQGLFRSV